MNPELRPAEAPPEENRWTLRCEREIDVEPGRAFELWTRYSDLPRAIACVRRIQRIGAGRTLWDVDVGGYQLVWEAWVTEQSPGRSLRWTSRWGTPNQGEIRFEPLPDGRSRAIVEIEYAPSGLLERLGARLGIVRREIEGALADFAAWAPNAPRRARAPAKHRAAPERAASRRTRRS